MEKVYNNCLIQLQIDLTKPIFRDKKQEKKVKNCKVRKAGKKKVHAVDIHFLIIPLSTNAINYLII